MTWITKAQSKAKNVLLALIGLGWGGCFPLAQLRVAELYPGPGLARVLGVFVMCEAFGSASGPWLTGVLFDRFGSYHWPLIVNVVSLLGAGLALMFSSVGRGSAGVLMRQT